MRIGNFVFLLPYSLLDVVVIQRRPASFGNRLLLGSRETSLSLSLSDKHNTHKYVGGIIVFAMLWLDTARWPKAVCEYEAPYDSASPLWRCDHPTSLTPACPCLYILTRARQFQCM